MRRVRPWMTASCLGLALHGGAVTAEAQPVPEAPATPETPSAPAPTAPPTSDGPAAPAPVTPPRITYAEDPIYPPSQLEGGEHPTVVFLVVIDREGAVRQATVEHSAGAAFDEAAREALMHWRFEPARRGDAPIASRIRVSIHFELPSFEAPTNEAHAHDVVELEGETLDGDRHDQHLHPEDDAAPMADAASGTPGGASTERDEIEAIARARAGSLRAESRSTGDHVLDRRALSIAPHADAGAMLRAAPGFVVTRPEGEAIAHRIMLRGFDAEHGQDVELTVEGLPINQPSHLHGQGYADLGFIIPEAVRSIRVSEGVYDPRQGDFAVAGSAEFDLGVTRRGLFASSSAGSFRTFREVLVVAPEGEPDETFLAVEARKTRGFGQNRAGMSASVLGQWRVDAGSTHLRVLGAASGARSDLAGVVRRDDLDEVGYLGAYPDATARAQNGFAARGLVALLGERRGEGGATSDFAVYATVVDFRSQTNFTGYTLASRENPAWRGRGDLVEQRNRTSTLGANFRHRGAELTLGSAVSGTLEVGSSVRVDRIAQSQNLIAAPQNETWDRVFDASVLGADLGFYVDADFDLGPLATVRGGVRADALFYDVDDRLGNYIPAYRREDYLVGYRRTAFGVVAGPRASLELHPDRGPRYFAAYGQGYRSPQAIMLEDGERAPFTKVHSADVGLRCQHDFADASIAWSATAFYTQLSDDIVFEPSENRFERVGGTRRTGAVATFEASAFDILDARFSLTGVRATLLAPPPPTVEDPSPPYARGQLLPYVPPIVVRTDLGAHHAFGDVEVSGGVGVSVVGARPLPYGQRTDAYAVVDARVGVEWKALSFAFSAENLLDARYPASEYAYVSSWNPAEVPSRIPERHIAAGAPRTLLVTIGVRP